jgi:hypothetical protein
MLESWVHRLLSCETSDGTLNLMHLKFKCLTHIMRLGGKEQNEKNKELENPNNCIFLNEISWFTLSKVLDKCV